MKNTYRRTHGRLVHGRRVQRLAETLADMTEPGWRIADVGCGDGRVGALVQALATDVEVEGYERSPRTGTAIPVHAFDGVRIPLDDGSADAIMLVDVLHHTDDPGVLLTEAARVARHAVLIKDHRTARPAAIPTLRFMDWMGNRAHGVPLPYNYWSEERWRAAWKERDLAVERFETRLGIYPWPAHWLFETGLHFVARLRPTATDS